MGIEAIRFIAGIIFLILESVHKVRYLRYACLSGKAGLLSKWSFMNCKLTFFELRKPFSAVLWTKEGEA